jgi:16S rRNA (guanine527-N7)-methyltransferase
MNAESLALVEELDFGLNQAQVGQLAALLDVLADQATAPTTIRERAQARDVHVADSLVALEVESLRAARTIADVGSGAGFPGLALAVALPEARVSLVESRRRACEFLSHAIDAAAVANTNVVCARAEEWAEGIGANDAVVARALAPQAVVLEYAAPLLRVGGSLVDWRGRRAGAEEDAAGAAAAALGMELSEVRAVNPFEGARSRHLHLFTKVAATPERFPRRAGVARKRPLASAASDRNRD